MSGASGNPRLSSLWKVQPHKAASIVMDALSVASGDIRTAAGILEVGVSTLNRWIRGHKVLQDAINRIRSEVRGEEETS